jgi:ketopantoate hydroxymethyltransferase
VLFLTDGQPTVPDRILESVKELMLHAQDIKKQVVIFALGIGNDRDIGQVLMKRIATLGYGEYHFVKNFAELTTWFEDLAKEFSVNLKKIPT